MGLSYLNESKSNRTYFTYFSEFERQCDKAYLWEMVILSIIFLVSLFGNILVITFIIRFPSMRQVTNYYITNLAVSDLVFSLTTPLVIATRHTEEWLLTNGVCHMMVYVMFVCGITSVWTMVLISMDRYRAIVKLKRDRSGFKNILFRIALVWIAGIIFSLPIVLFFKQLRLTLPNNKLVQVCTLDWQNQLSSIIYCTLNLIFVFCIPLGLITRNYRLIMETFNNSRRRMREYSQSGPQVTLNTRRNSILSTTTAREIRTMTMLILMVILFAIMWFPIILIQFFLIMDWVYMQSWNFITVLSVTYLNGAINPIVYGLLNQQYRTQFRDVFQKIRCRCCKCNLCPVKGTLDLEMKDTPDRADRTPVVAVCVRALELAGDVALGSNRIAIGKSSNCESNYSENPIFECNEDIDQK